MTHQQNRWNEKYANRGPKRLAPERFLIERKNLLCPGTVLDVACGDGRHSIYLARSGFAVTGVDFSEKGLGRLDSSAAQEELDVKTYQRDIDAEGALSDLGRFNNIVVVHFKPTLHTFRALCEMLCSQGIFMMTSFNMKQHERHGFPERYCYSEREYASVSEELELIEYMQYEDERGYFDGYVFRKH